MSRDPDDPRLEELQRLLDVASEDQREILAEAEREAGEDDRAFMERALERAAAAEGARPPRRWAWALAAAAALLLGWLGLRGVWAPPGGGPAGTVLGDDDLVLVSPVGEVAAYGSIRWTFPISDAITFEVLVRDAATDEVLLEERVEGRLSLSPDSRVTVAWPERIDVELRAFDGPDELASCSASAWLRL